MTSWSCAGHPGHIELPIRVFNITFFDQMFRLLKAQCVYCHKLRINRVQINDYICKLRLLQYGLVDEAAQIDKIGQKAPGASQTHGRSINGVGSDKDSDDDLEADEPGNTIEIDPEDLIDKKKAFTRKCIKQAKKGGAHEPMSGSKDPVAAEERRNLLRTFFKDIVAAKNCSSCHG
jgi:DNA-directed RNA polymerase I subunit RPA1